MPAKLRQEVWSGFFYAWMSDWPGGSDWKFAGRFGLEVCSLDDAGDSFRILGEILSFLDL